MTSLRSKLIKNFIAGILACVLIYSILITLQVSLKYNHLFELEESKDTKYVIEWFNRLNDDPLVSKDSMWSYLREITQEKKINLRYIDNDTNEINSINNMDEIISEDISTKTYRIFAPSRKFPHGKLEIDYIKDFSTVNILQNDFRNALLMALIISISIGLVIAIVLSKNISIPIREITDETKKIKAGIYEKSNFDDSNINEIHNLQNNIKFLSESLRSEEIIRKKYAQDISHELRTPLTNLRLYVEAIDDGIIEYDSKFSSTMMEELNRLQSLIDDLKKSFDESVSINKLDLKETNLTTLIERVLIGFKGNFLSKGIKIEKDLGRNIEFLTDQDKFIQVLQNLISNSIKAIGEDGTIKISLKESSKHIILIVEDDGIGMDDDMLDMIFERFFRIEDSRNTKTNGVGLGLSITKNYVLALGGKIEVESEKDIGTSFIVTFYK